MLLLLLAQLTFLLLHPYTFSAIVDLIDCPCYDADVYKFPLIRQIVQTFAYHGGRIDIGIYLHSPWNRYSRSLRPLDIADRFDETGCARVSKALPFRARGNGRNDDISVRSNLRRCSVATEWIGNILCVGPSLHRAYTRPV